MTRLVHLYVAGVAGVAAAMVIGVAVVDSDPDFGRLWLALVFAAVLTLEHFFEGRIAHKSGQRESFGHEESFLVAMALLLPPVVVIVGFGVAVLAGNMLLRREAVKALFNVAAMLAAAGAGLLSVVAIAGTEPEGIRGAAAVVAGAAVFIVVDNVAVSGVLALTRAATFRGNLVDDIGGRAIIWSGDTAIGLLAGLAGAAHLWSLAFALVAMFALHFALTGHARARAERQKLEDIVNSSSDGIYTVDSHDRVTSWNRACEAITGHASAHVLGLTHGQVFDLLHARPQPQPDATSRLDPEGKEPEHVRIEAAGGETRWVAVTRAPLPQGGVVVVLRDETTRREMEELAARRERERLTADLVASVSHELRTPLTSVLGFTATLLAHDLDEGTRRRALEIVHTEADRLAELIDDLLEFRRIEEGTFRIERETVDLAAVLSEQVALFSGESSAHALVLDVPSSRLEVHADRDRLSQVVSNLISNAIKYSPDGGQVTVRGSSVDGAVRVAVADQGIGIAEVDQQHVFTPFFRAEEHGRRRIRGTGLGLALAREIIEAHGGTIGFETVKGRGSTFWFELPAQ
jgi:PAS domain S-box-containing protein